MNICFDIIHKKVNNTMIGSSRFVNILKRVGGWCEPAVEKLNSSMSMIHKE
jgi:hypothetical protein